jgi:hypothetical protein
VKSPFRWLQTLGVNAVPIGGVFLGGWSAATALALYWWENALGALLVALRIALHRRLTRKRGHLRPQLGIERKIGGRTAPFRSFLAEYAVGALLFTAAHGVLLAVLFSTLLADRPDRAALGAGVAGIAALQLAGFARDAIGLRQRPFAWIRGIASQSLARVVLIHLAIVGGMAFLAWQGRAPAFFGPFAVLKLLADLAGLLPGRQGQLDEAPAWMDTAVSRLEPGKERFADHWRRQRQRQHRDEQRDEETLP